MIRVPKVVSELFSLAKKLLIINVACYEAAALLPNGENAHITTRNAHWWKGVIDATEWVGPALDLKMGFYRVAPYYYSGWHEPGSVLELTFNKHTWNKLAKNVMDI